MAAFIQVEAVNLGDTVFDTDQLSVIRGGSLLIKAAIEAVRDKFSGRMQALSTGASMGLFQTAEAPAGLVTEIRDFLANDKTYGLFTFLIEACTRADLREAKTVLAARLRFAQLRSANRVPDAVPSGATRPCEVEGRRAAQVGQQIIQGKTVADSVSARWKFGRKQRHHLYPGLAGDDPALQRFLRALDFTDEIGELANCEALPKLNNKVAVLYLDGNGFGAIQAATVRTAEDQQAFDTTIQDYRRTFLMRLLSRMIPDPKASEFVETVTPAEQEQLRLETLLWGGDESLIVVPAWLGFAVLNLFFEMSRDWAFRDHRLTHAVGLVFCHAKTPIFRMRELARQVAEHVKDRGGRDDNGFDYVVLESVDFPTEGSFEGYLNARYGTELVARRAVMRPFQGWAKALPVVRSLLRGGVLARGQVYGLVQALTAPDAVAGFVDGLDAERPAPWSKAFGLQRLTVGGFERAEQRLFQVAEEEDLAAHIDTLAAAWGVDLNRPVQRAWLWLHLVELWDYLLPVHKQPVHKQPVHKQEGA